MGDPGWIPLFLIYIKELSQFLLLRVFFQSSYRANLKVQMAIKVEEGLSKSVKSGNTLFSVKELWMEIEDNITFWDSSEHLNLSSNLSS